MRDALEKKESPCRSDVYLTHNDIVAGGFSFHLLKIAFIKIQVISFNEWNFVQC